MLGPEEELVLFVLMCGWNSTSRRGGYKADLGPHGLFFSYDNT